MAIHLITGATGAVGGALMRRLLADGHTVLALVRDPLSAPGVTEVGAEPVVGDLLRPEAWGGRLAAAEVVWHAGLPRWRPPVRATAARKATRDAQTAAAALAGLVGDRPLVMASTLLLAGEGTAPALARPAQAAEAALAAHPALRVLRTGWVYGPDGMIGAMVNGLRGGRYRIVGDGTNRMSLISPHDAAAAMAAALTAPPGVYAAAEQDVPTHTQLVAAICAATGARRPDHLPPRMAALSFGGALADALTRDIPTGGPPPPPGWHPEHDWRRDLVALVR